MSFLSNPFTRYGLGNIGYQTARGRDLRGNKPGSGDPFTPKGYDRFSNLNPQQRQIFDQLAQILGGGGNFQQAQDYQSQLLSGDPEATKAFEAPYMRQFNEKVIPGIAERFSGAGAGAQSSSAFQQALGGAGADLQERLAQLREGLRYQASNQPFEQLMRVLGLETEGLVKKELPWWQQALVAFGGGAGQALGMGGKAALGGF